MAWLSGEYLIVCVKCSHKMFRSDAVKDRTGLLGHRGCIDELQPGFDTPWPRVPVDPVPLEAWRINMPGVDVFRTDDVSTTVYWNIDITTWDADIALWESN